MASEWHPCTRWARTPGLIKGHFLSTWSFQLIKSHKVNTCFPCLGTRKLRSKGLFPGSRHWRQQSGFQPSGWLQSPGPPQASAPCTSPGGQGRLGGAAPLPVTDGRAVGLPGLEAADPSSTRADSRPSQQPLVDTVTIWGGGAVHWKAHHARRLPRWTSWGPRDAPSCLRSPVTSLAKGDVRRLLRVPSAQAQPSPLLSCPLGPPPSSGGGRPSLVPPAGLWPESPPAKGGDKPRCVFQSVPGSSWAPAPGTR